MIREWHGAEVRREFDFPNYHHLQLAKVVSIMCRSILRFDICRPTLHYWLCVNLSYVLTCVGPFYFFVVCNRFRFPLFLDILMIPNRVPWTRHGISFPAIERGTSWSTPWRKPLVSPCSSTRTGRLGDSAFGMR